MEIKYLLIALVVVVTLMAALLIYARFKKKSDEVKIIGEKKKGKRKNYLFFLFRFFKITPGLSNYFFKIYDRVLLLYPADSYSVNLMTTRILALGTVAGVAAVAFVLVISQGDVFFLCCGLLITYVLITGVVNLQLNVIEKKIMEQMSEALSKVRHYYQNTGIVESSIALALDELPYEISLHFQNIYDVITSADLKYEVDQYIASSPNKYMTTFLSICSTVKEMGDKKLEDGTSVFITDLNYLKENINDDYMAQERHKEKFQSLGVISLLGILLIKPAQNMITGSMEETASFYNGIYGIVTMVSIFLITFCCYKIILTLRDKGRNVEKNDNLFSKLAQLPFIEPVLQKMIRKKYVRYMRSDKDLQASGDHSGAMAFLFSRILYALAAFTATVVLLFSSEMVEKYQLMHSFADGLTEVVVPSEEYRQVLQQTAKAVAQSHKYSRDITVEELTKEVIQDPSISRETYAEKVAELAYARITQYGNTYFKYWYLLIAVFIGWVAYMAPVAMLKIRKNVIQTRKREEVMQFQNLMLILMHMDGITVAEILEWMERFSFCFKEDIATCRVNLSQGEHEALVDLKMSTDYAPFSEFVDNLIAIDKVGVEEAFDEIKTDQKFYKDQHALEQDKDTKKKASTASVLAFVPLMAVIGLYIILPMLIYAYNAYAEMKTII